MRNISEITTELKESEGCLLQLLTEEKACVEQAEPFEDLYSAGFYNGVVQALRWVLKLEERIEE